MFFKRRTKKNDTSLTPVAAPWLNCIAVCTKCSRKVREMDGDKTRLRVQLKALIALRGLKKKVRVVDTSCLDVCPEEKITVTHFTATGAHVVNVGPSIRAEQILAEFCYDAGAPQKR